MTTKAIEARISEAVMRHAVSEADGNAALDELKTLRERVDYLEDAVEDGGAAYRAARIGLGVPAFDDDYLALKARAEKAERCSLALDDTVAKQGELYRSMKERAEKAEAEASQARNDLAKERAGQTKYDAELWRARCQDAEAELARVVFQAGELRAKVARQRRELRRLNFAQHHYNAGKDRAIYWVGRVATECFRDVVVKRLGDDVHRLVEDAKRAAKTEEKPAEDGTDLDRALRSVGR